MAAPPRFRRSSKRRQGRVPGWLVNGVLIVLLIAAWQAWNSPELRQRAGFPMSPGERVTASFALCDTPGYAVNCVVDGDTFRMGTRRIRIEGIDTAEREGRCEAETAQASASTDALMQWLARGPFEMLRQDETPYDQYGRELQTVWRTADNGARDDLADFMIREGGAHVYQGRKLSWCD